MAFIGGMNVKDVDWDSSEHLVFDPRRMEFEATESQRLAVVAREADPDFGPARTT